MTTVDRRLYIIGLLCGTSMITGCLEEALPPSGIKFCLYMSEESPEDVNDEYLDFDAANLSADEREILEEAIAEDHYTEGWTGNEPPGRAFSDALVGVEERISEAEGRRPWREYQIFLHARYDGQFYWLQREIYDQEQRPGDC